MLSKEQFFFWMILFYWLKLFTILASSPLSPEEEEIRDLADELDTLDTGTFLPSLEVSPAPPIPSGVWFVSTLAILASSLGFFLLNKRHSRLKFWQKIVTFLLVVIAYITILDRCLQNYPEFFLLFYICLYLLVQFTKDLIATFLKLKTIAVFFLRYLSFLVIAVILGIILKEISPLTQNTNLFDYGYLLSGQFSALLLKYLPRSLIALVSGVILATIACFYPQFVSQKER